MLNILFYTLATITIIIALINIVIAKQNKIKIDYKKRYIESCRIIILTLVALMIIYAKIDDKDNYIQNIETKLNIYEQSYDNFVLEDSLRQSDIYERVR
ncbi:MAG: hypothetical protein HFJ41_03810 [Clostridia bacterium]|nr:hypothetical protein [Clostridia bacterium]